MPLYDCGSPECQSCIDEFRQVEQTEIDKAKEALRPFAEYGELLRGQRVRHDRALLDLWGREITGDDLIKAADVMTSL